MKNRTHSYSAAFLNILLFALLFLLHYTKALHIGAIKANPITLIPLLTAFAMFNEEWVSAITGLIVGIFMDSSSMSASFFHTVTFMLLGLAVSFTVHYLFNNNWRSAVTLSLLATLFYFLLRWIFFHTVGGDIKDSLYYLMQYALPSVIYTNLFIFPFYLLERKLYNFNRQ